MSTARKKPGVKVVPPPGRKGASRKQSPARGKWPVPNLAKIFVGLVLLILPLICYVSYLAVQTALNVPVSQVDIEGEFTYLDRRDVTHVIDNFVEHGFLTVDIRQLQKDFQALPWVASAQIHRKLPNGLTVLLQEQKPFAYWNDNALINAEGTVFHPVPLPEIKGLPRFSGHSYRQVATVYKHLLANLPETQLPLAGVVIEDQNTLRVTLVSGAILVMEASQFESQVALWKTLSSSDLQNKMQDIEYVDLRYNSGAAVKFRQDSLAIEDKR